MGDKPNIWIYWDNYPGRQTPAYIKLCWESIVKHCKDDFVVNIINSDNVKQHLPDIREDFFKMSQINNKSNYLRYKLLCEHGGIWLDSDLVVLQSLMPLMSYLEEHELIATGSPEYGYGEPESGFIISKKGGKIITKAVAIINGKMDNNPVGHVFPWGSMGPSVIRAAVKGENYYHLKSNVLMPIGWQHAFKFDKIDRMENYLTKNTFAFMLYNEMFRRSNSPIMSMSREQLLDSKWLIGQIFRKALS